MKMNNTIDFISWYFNANEHFYISIIDNKTSKTQNYIHNVESFKNNYKKILYNNKTKSLYFTYNTFNTEYGKRIVNVTSIKSMLFDFDEVETSTQDLKKLLSIFPNPSYILQSSPNKYQVCYRLNSMDVSFKDFSIIHKVLSNHFNSDINVCSVEKLFRLPFSINRKNDFQTVLQEFNGNTTLFNDFKEYFKTIVEDNSELREYCKTLAKKAKSKQSGVKNKNQPKKAIKISNKTIKANKKIQKVSYQPSFIKLDNKLIGKYKNILKRNNDDASISDIHYIRVRAKQNVEYDLIFNELISLRNILEKPFNRDINEYYTERYNSIYINT